LTSDQSKEQATMATASNIHVGQGEVWIGGTAPAAGSNPTDPTAGTPSEANAMTTNFAAPVSGGTNVGFTQGPATITYRPTYYMVETEQSFAEVVSFPTAEEASFSFTTLEASYQNMANAIGQGKTRTVVGPPAFDVIYVGSNSVLQVSVVTLMSRHRSGTGYYIATIYQGYSMEGIAANFTRREEARFPITMRALGDVTRPVGDQLFQIARYAANPA
jgi:hypothetical protein